MTSLPTNLITLMIRLFRHISLRRRRQFLLLLALALVGSFAEVASLGTVVPFIGILTRPEKVFHYHIASRIAHMLGISAPSDLVLPLVVTFSVTVLASGGLRLLLSWISIHLANATGADLSIDMYRRTLYQPYRVHISRSSSEVISGITQKVINATSVLVSIVGIITSTVLFVAILTALFVIDPMVATVSTLSFGMSYGFIAWRTRRRLLQNSRLITQEQTQVIKALQEGLGAIRDVLLDGTQAIYCAVYSRAAQRLQRANSENAYINQAPRHLIESLGMVLISVLALVLRNRPGGVGASLPLLAALALGAQRLLPLLQQLYSSWSNITSNQATLTDVLNLLDQPLPDDCYQPAPLPLTFQHSIRFDSVHFHYGNKSHKVLNGVNLTIPKGTRVGIIGSTGSGKSTALDLLMSLIGPTQGKILVDDQPISGQYRRAWQRTIAHVPQSIYLADSTIAENIAFGVPTGQIDMERVQQVAEQAQIAEFIEARSEGYNTFVGERGIRLSGGQRQRIGIARALYKQATVLVFDEATSALDGVTEHEVMRAIESLNRDLTVLLVAHRFTTLQYCDTIVKLERGQIVAQGSYEYFVKSDPSVQGFAKTGNVAVLPWKSTRQ